MVSLRTERLILREWRADDLPAYAALNADPRVMAHFPAVITREASDAQAVRIAAHFEAHGFGLFAVEVAGISPFIGFCGLARPGFAAPRDGWVEIGWRLARTAWGHGYAREAARRVLADAFTRLAFHEIVSFTVPANVRSRRVMETIGMRHDPDGDFAHPRIDATSPLSRHILYRLARADWRRGYTP